MKENFKEPNLSRREFLKAMVGGAAFLAGLSLSKEALAKLEDLLGSQEFVQENFQKTLQRLKKEVYENSKEVFWAHVQKGGREYAVNILHEATETRAKAVDLTRLYEDKDVTQIYFVHTHPAKIFTQYPSFPKKEVEKIFREKRSDYALLPSGTDVIQLLADKIAMKEQGIQRELAHFLVEPSGVWQYDIDPEHPFCKDNVRPRDDTDSLADAVRSNGALHMVLNDAFMEQEKKMFEAGGMKEDDFQKLNEWAQKEYGISFTYKKFETLAKA